MGENGRRPTFRCSKVLVAVAVAVAPGGSPRRGEQRKENSYPEIEFEIDTEEDSPADILLQASGMLLDCSVMVAKAAFLVGLMEAEADEDDEDDENDEHGTTFSHEGR